MSAEPKAANTAKDEQTHNESVGTLEGAPERLEYVAQIVAPKVISDRHLGCGTARRTSAAGLSSRRPS